MKLLTYIFFLLLIASCGKAPSNRINSSMGREISYFFMENNCRKVGQFTAETVVKIKELYQLDSREYPINYFTISFINYDFKKPLIISEESLKLEYEKLVTIEASKERSEAIYHLYQKAVRFSDQACAFEGLKENKKNDIRPYLNLIHRCEGKYNSESCDEREFQVDEEAKNEILSLCEAFFERSLCLAEFVVEDRKSNLDKYVVKYQKRFEEEKYQSLFKITPGHQKFECSKISDDKIEMTIKIKSSYFDKNYLSNLLVHVNQLWKSNSFAINFIMSNDSDSVEILPSNKTISFVPKDNTKIIYLSPFIDLDTQKKVLAHEFGHVLGFPDCYVEFFDGDKKELVYYEINQKNQNIMCSMKDGVLVEEDYLSQLKEKSCIFK